jgi:hypothetical protein
MKQKDQFTGQGFMGVFLHANTIPSLTGGRYLVGVGRMEGDPEDMVIMMRYESLQGDAKPDAVGMVSGNSASEVQAKASKILQSYDGLLAGGMKPKDAVLQSLAVLHQE